MAAETYRISLDAFDPDEYPGGWVDIRDRMGFAARKKIETAGLGSWTPSTNGSAVRVEGFDLLEAAITQMATAIVAWSLPWPTDSEEQIRSALMSDEFDADLGDWLMSEIDAHYKARMRTAEDRKRDRASA